MLCPLNITLAITNGIVYKCVTTAGEPTYFASACAILIHPPLQITQLLLVSSLLVCSYANTIKNNNGPFSSVIHAGYCAFMYTFTEKHVCFHVSSLFYLVLTFDPTGKGSIDSYSPHDDDINTAISTGCPNKHCQTNSCYLSYLVSVSMVVESI